VRSALNNGGTFRNQTTILSNIPLHWRDEYVSLALGRERKTIRGEAARALFAKDGRVVEVWGVEPRARAVEDVAISRHALPDQPSLSPFQNSTHAPCTRSVSTMPGCLPCIECYV
jgi:hypothetical protein